MPSADMLTVTVTCWPLWPRIALFCSWASVVCLRWACAVGNRPQRNEYFYLLRVGDWQWYRTNLKRLREWMEGEDPDD